MALLRSREALRLWEALLSSVAEMVDLVHFSASPQAFGNLISPRISQAIRTLSRLRVDVQAGGVNLGAELEQVLASDYGWNGHGFDRHITAMDLLSTLKSFRVVSEQSLGRGAYARVFLARNQLTGETVVHKHVQLESAEHGMPLHVLRELALLKKMKHPHIVKCAFALSLARTRGSVVGSLQRHQLSTAQKGVPR